MLLVGDGAMVYSSVRHRLKSIKPVPHDPTGPDVQEEPRHGLLHGYKGLARRVADGVFVD